MMDKPLSDQNPLIRREKLILCVVTLTYLWTCWVMGGVKLELQFVTAGLAILGFAMLFIPTGWEDSRHGGPRENFKALLKFPIFWFGLLLMVYITIQGLNPRYFLAPAGKAMFYMDLEYVKWLPSGIKTPLREMNPWRMLLMLGSPWLVFCTIWLGLKRRKALRILLWIFAVNAFVWAVVAYLQHITGTTLMLWFMEPPVRVASGFWGTILNVNHAAAFLNLGILAQLTLFMHLAGRPGTNFMRGGPHLLLLPMAVATLAVLLRMPSRAALFVLAVTLLLFLMIGVIKVFKLAREGYSPLVGVALLVLLLSGMGLSLKAAIDLPVLRAEFQTAIKVAEDLKNDLRYYINLASIDMIKERPVYGWGAGAYRYHIASFEKKYPEIPQVNYRGARLSTVYAHNDYLQYLAELGWVGVSFILAGAAYLTIKVLLRLGSVDTGLALGAMGIPIFLSHAAVEFFFFHPLLLLAFGLLLAIFTRLIDLSGKVRRATQRMG